MGFVTGVNENYIHGKNLATMVNRELAGTVTHVKGSKVKDAGVYEITFVYSVRKEDTTNATTNANFYIGFGTLTNSTSGSFNNVAMVRLGADNVASSVYSNQASVTVWVLKTNELELDFMCKEAMATTTWRMYNINAVAKKIADI